MDSDNGILESLYRDDDIQNGTDDDNSEDTSE